MAAKLADRSPWWLAAAAAVGALGGAGITGGFNYLSHQNDLDAKMIELSVGILRAAPTPETTPLREWAIDVIEKRANFSFNAAQRATLLKNELPFKYGGFSFDSDFFREIRKPDKPPEKEPDTRPKAQPLPR